MAEIQLRRRALLIILDGFGVNPGKLNNAIYEARTPRLDHYFGHNAHAVLEASGPAVGLPPGQMGNSEVGHMILGCGSVIRHDLVRIDSAIADESFYTNAAFDYALNRARESGRPLHLLGLVSDGGIHSHLSHLLALIELCRRENVRPLVHMITDGRDTAPRYAATFLPALEAKLEEAGGAIATVSGRYYAMDRDTRWKRTEKAWQAMVNQVGEKADNAAAALEAAYASDLGDEFILPTVLPQAEPVAADDSIIFFNFRNDRTRQLTRALTSGSFDAFERGDFQPVSVVTMTEYDARFQCPIAFTPERPSMTMGKLISDAGLRQFHCAETEKYAHVTLFFNGGREDPFAGEDRKLIPSPDVATYDLKPDMSAREVADAVVEALGRQEYALAVVNFANGDMVGHTAVHPAVVDAVEALDESVGRVLDAAVENDYSVLLTADHGNCDETVDPLTGEPHTQHTTYPVPCLVVDKSRWRLANGSGLSSVAPTLLQLMGLEQPTEMTGTSLLLEELPSSGFVDV